MIAERRLCLTADRKTVVEATDKRAAFLLCAKGQEIPKVIVDQYDLVKYFEKKKKQPANKAVLSTENKKGV